MADETPPEVLIDTLRRLCDEHGVRAETLVPDLALTGLVLDILDAALTGLDLLNSDRPYRAYSMVRIAFEATQRLLVLATSRNYVALGTRAWLYYRRKDTRLTTDPESILGPQEEQLVTLWATHFPTAVDLVQQETDALHRLRGPDNFLGRDMAEAVNEAYAAFASELGSSVPENSADINRAIYRSLSRDSHAAMRLELSGLRIDADGFVEIHQRPRTRDDVAPPVRNALQITLTEALAALRYRIQQRRRQHAERLAASLAPAPSDLPSGYVPDFGRSLLEKGLGHAEAVFPRIPVQDVNELNDGTLSVSVTSREISSTQMATFDFKGETRDQLLATIAERFPEAVARSATQPLRIHLADPIFLTIRASLGMRQNTAKEPFVPFIVNGFSVDLNHSGT
jgi:hypothetical protein